MTRPRAGARPYAQRRRPVELVEDVEFMLATGRGWGEVCTRLGRSPAALTKALARAGRYDLVAAAGLPAHGRRAA